MYGRNADHCDVPCSPLSTGVHADNASWLR